MATTRYLAGDVNAVELWAKVLEMEALKLTPIASLIGTDANSIIHRKTELSKEKGDKVYFNLLSQLTGTGVNSTQTLKGNEESLAVWQDSLLIEEAAHAVDVPPEGTMSNVRTAFDLDPEVRKLLANWAGVRYAKSFFNQVCGNTVQTDTKLTGNNTVTAATSARVVRPNAITADESLTTSDKMSLAVIRKAKKTAKILSPMIKPTRVDGEDWYVMYLDPRQVHDMKSDMSTGEWPDIQKALFNGTGDRKNPFFTGALGVYDGVVLREADDTMLPAGINSSTGAAVSNTKRAVFLGAQAAAIGFSQGGGPTVFKYVEEMDDFNRTKGVAIRFIYGLKKCIFNSKDYGTIVVPTYAAD